MAGKVAVSSRALLINLQSDVWTAWDIGQVRTVCAPPPASVCQAVAAAAAAAAACLSSRRSDTAADVSHNFG